MTVADEKLNFKEVLNLKVSQNNQRLQKTKYLGSSAENKVELLKISKECIEDFRQLQIEKSVNLNMDH